MDCVVVADFNLPSTRVKIQEYFMHTPVVLIVLAPACHTCSACPQRDWWRLSASTAQRQIAQLRGQLVAHQLSQTTRIALSRASAEDIGIV